MESLTPIPELENSLVQKQTSRATVDKVRFRG